MDSIQVKINKENCSKTQKETKALEKALDDATYLIEH